MEIKNVLDKPGENEAIENIYATIEKGPTEDVTQHVMDSDGKALAILLPYKWTDVGTWGSVYEFFADGTATMTTATSSRSIPGLTYQNQQQDQAYSRRRRRRPGDRRYGRRVAGDAQGRG